MIKREHKMPEASSHVLAASSPTGPIRDSNTTIASTPKESAAPPPPTLFAFGQRTHLGVRRPKIDQRTGSGFMRDVVFDALEAEERETGC